MFTPNSTIRLLSVPLTMGDGKQMDFTNVAAQTAYFQAHSKFTYTEYNYQRQDRAVVVSIPGGVDALLHCNYVMYQNQNFTNKWFYAFITKKEWVSENAARLYLKTDVFQTWLFAFKLMPSMVMREHTVTDGFYEHTLPEKVYTDEPIEIYRHRATTYNMNGTNMSSFDANYRCIVCSSMLWKGNVTPTTLLGGTPRAAFYYGFARTVLQSAIRDMIQENGADSIISVYAVPIGALTWEEWNVGDWHFYVPIDKAADSVEIYIPPSASPQWAANIKNKKCLCYPYHYYVLHDYAGHKVDISPQDINKPKSEGKLKLRTYFNGGTNPAAYCVPLYYKNTGDGIQPELGASYDYALCYTDFPELAYKSDFFDNYLALNRSKLTMQSASLIMKTTAGFMQSPLEGLHGIDAINAAAANLIDMQKIPDKINGDIGGNVQLRSGSTGIWLSEYRIKDEYLRMLDDYFTMYGYAVNRLKTPQFNSRPLFNYLQTSGIDISGDIPQDDLEELQGLFNSGITVWHAGSNANYNNFGNYGGDNSPV